MTIFIAFLRGINVGGNKRIKMTDLKSMFESMGLMSVETYIQSGNVIFESNEKEDTLREKITDMVQTNFGFSAVVVLRTAVELEELIQDCPFSQEEITAAESSNTAGKNLYVSLLTQAPSQDKIEYLKSLTTESDQFRIRNRDIYLVFRHSIRNSKLANNLQKIDVSATIRNWNTINRLHALAKSRMASDESM